MPRKKSEPPDCLSCGLCCVVMRDQDAFCDVTPKDLEKLDRRWIGRNVLFPSAIDTFAAMIDGAHLPFGAIATKWREVKDGPLKGIEVCACVALRGNVGHAVKCSIYAKRPQVCHDAVKPGDRTCFDIRRLVNEAVEREAAKDA